MHTANPHQLDSVLGTLSSKTLTASSIFEAQKKLHIIANNTEDKFGFAYEFYQACQKKERTSEFNKNIFVKLLNRFNELATELIHKVEFVDLVKPNAIDSKIMDVDFLYFTYKHKATHILEKLLEKRSIVDKTIAFTFMATPDPDTFHSMVSPMESYELVGFSTPPNNYHSEESRKKKSSLFDNVKEGVLLDDLEINGCTKRLTGVNANEFGTPGNVSHKMKGRILQSLMRNAAEGLRPSF